MKYQEVKRERSEETIINDELVVKYQKGEIEFDQVFKAFDKLIKKLAHKWVPGTDYDDRYQELCARFYICLDKWDSSKDLAFKSYLCTACDNQIAWMIRKANTDKKKANYLKDNASYECLVEFGLEDREEQELDMSYNIDELTSRTEILDGVVLTEEEKIICDLIFEGEKKVDIVKKLNLSRTRLNTILKRLQFKFDFLLV